MARFGTTLVLREGGKRPEPEAGPPDLEEIMTTTTMNMESTGGEAVVARDVGLTGRVIVSWTVGGGLLLGGFLLAAMTLAGRLSANALLMTAGVLYVAGCVLGFTHGAVLGFLGRPADVTAREAVGRLGMAALYAIPALIVGFLAAGWIAMTVLALYIGRTLPLIGVGFGWMIGGVLVLAAAMYGVQALRNAYARWEDRRLGTVLVAASFAALLVLFLAERPELWGSRFVVTETGAVLLAAFGAIWIAGPVVTAALFLVRRLEVPVIGMERAPRTAASLAIGLTAGVVLGVIALPAHQAAFATGVEAGTVGTLVNVVSHTLVDEMLLRLFLMTGIVWALVRFYATPGPRAAIAAVAVAAVVQMMLYAPGVSAIGFPTFTAAAGYMALTVALPAMVFGALYWKRGFATAVLAHASALLAVALMI
jgi:hypothetical protein